MSAVSGSCLLSGRGGLFALVGKLFYPGLLSSLIVLRTVNLSTIIMAFLLNAVFYVLLFFFLFRWRTASR